MYARNKPQTYHAATAAPDTGESPFDIDAAPGVPAPTPPLANDAESQSHQEAPHNAQEPGSKRYAPGELPPTERRKRTRLWCAVRIIDYRLQALAPTDPDYPLDDLDWCDIGPDTAITADREAMYQAARTHDGLLMSTAGLPTAGRMTAFQRASATMQALHDGTPPPKAQPAPTSPPVEADEAF